MVQALAHLALLNHNHAATAEHKQEPAVHPAHGELMAHAQEKDVLLAQLKAKAVATAEHKQEPAVHPAHGGLMAHAQEKDVLLAQPVALAAQLEHAIVPASGRIQRTAQQKQQLTLMAGQICQQMTCRRKAL